MNQPAPTERAALQALQSVRTAQHHELIPRPHDGVRRRVVLHPAVGALNADDDDTERAGAGSRRPATARPGEPVSAMRICSIASSRFSELRRELRRNRPRPAGARSGPSGPRQSGRARRRGRRRPGCSFRSASSVSARADDVEIGPQHPGREHGVDVLRIGADRRDQPAGPIDADALEHLLLAGVGFDGQVAAVEHRLHALGVPLDDDEGNALPPELVGNDAADPSRSAQDEMVRRSRRSYEPVGAAPGAGPSPPSTTAAASSVNP